MESDRSKAGRRIVCATLTLFLSIALGVIQYRGPSPRAIDASPDRPSAARMRQTLVELLGDPPQKHTTGTEAGEAFLRRLESKIRSFGIESQRIEIPWDEKEQDRHPEGRVDLLPPGTILKNLLVTIPGSEPDLAPILVATHHDSCRWGPGAGDAGSAVVALVEHIRILSAKQPVRTTQYLFTDGEEYGLLGAYAIARQDPLPIRVPVFVLNFDARGTSGAVPMFETHSNNAVWVNRLIGHLASPKMTSSLAVTVYRSLPNATDFNAWHGTLGFPGFNYATIGGAHRYHRPDDRPENLSDRTLQHMGDHLYRMHGAIDQLDASEVGDEADGAGQSAVFFDLFGVTVVHFGETLQKGLAVIGVVLLVVGMFRQKTKHRLGSLAFHAVTVGIAIIGGIGIGWCSRMILRTTPWSNLRYTPVDLPAGLITLAATFVIVTLLLERLCYKRLQDNVESVRDWTWLITAILGTLLAFWLPGGGYLLILPSLAYALVRVSTGRTLAAAWCGWIAVVILAGPLLSLLVQALGPWQQPMYAALASLLAVQAMPTWLVPLRRAAL